MKLPKNWEEKEFKDISEFINGRAFKPSEWKQSGIPIIRIQNLNDPSAKFNYYDGAYDSRNLIKNGDILISWSASLGVFKWNRGDAILNQHIFKVNLFSTDVEKEYFYQYAKTKIEEMKTKVHGSTMKHITKPHFEKTKILIPPIKIQKKIVSILERAEKLKEKREQANALTAQLGQSVFLEMFWNVKYKIVTLKEVCKKITDGSHNTPKLLSEGYPFLTVANMGKSYFYYDGCKRISKDDYEKLVKNDCKPLKGDILFSKDGTVGKVMEITKEKEEVVLSSIAILRPNSALILPTFLAEYLKTDYALGQAIDKKSGSAIRRIVLKDIKTIKIPIPPLEEQKSFVEKIKLNYSITEKQQHSDMEISLLFDSLMQKAFNGELVG